MARPYDVVIAGAGNAALCAAHAARERVQRVLVLEKAPREWAGGNSYFTAGACRTTFESLEDLLPILHQMNGELAAMTDLPAYTEANFAADMTRVTQGRCDPELTEVLIHEAAPAL